MTRITFEGYTADEFWAFLEGELSKRGLWKIEVELLYLNIEDLGYRKGFAVSLTDNPCVVIGNSI